MFCLMDNAALSSKLYSFREKLILNKLDVDNLNKVFFLRNAVSCSKEQFSVRVQYCILSRKISNNFVNKSVELIVSVDLFQ
jgi:hypothetical protein